jgi:ribonucleotide reductase beta subunit family protein with ferritin-like domain
MPKLSLGLDLTYRTVDLLFQLVHSKRGTESRRAIKFFQKASIGELVHVDREPPDQHGHLAELMASSKEHPWDPDQIDFSVDQRGWSQISYWDRGLVSAITRMFFLGDSMVSRLLEPITANAPEQDEREYFLMQAAEEDRHWRFFQTFLAQVLSVEGDQRQLERKFRWRTLPSFNKSFRDLAATIALLQNLRTPEQWVEAVTIYHMVAEGMIADRGTRVVAHILKGDARKQLLPGFLKGFKYVCAEESRHIAGGVKALQRRIHDQPELARIVLITLARMAKPASGINLPWLPKFPEMPQHLHRRLISMGITEEAARRASSLFAA